MEVSFGHGKVPVTTYRKVEVVVFILVVNVPAAASKLPPVPLNLVQVPPDNALFKLKRFIVLLALLQTEILPFFPAIVVSHTLAGA